MVVVDAEALEAKEAHVAADEEDEVRWLGWVLEPPWSQYWVKEIVKESWYCTPLTMVVTASGATVLRSIRFAQRLWNVGRV